MLEVVGEALTDQILQANQDGIESWKAPIIRRGNAQKRVRTNVFSNSHEVHCTLGLIAILRYRYRTPEKLR